MFRCIAGCFSFYTFIHEMFLHNDRFKELSLKINQNVKDFDFFPAFFFHCQFKERYFNWIHINAWKLSICSIVIHVTDWYQSWKHLVLLCTLYKSKHFLSNLWRERQELLAFLKKKEQQVNNTNLPQQDISLDRFHNIHFKCNCWHHKEFIWVF